MLSACADLACSVGYIHEPILTADIRREICNGQSSIHALANQLDQEGFWSRVQYAPDGHVISVLFAHPDSLGYLQVGRLSIFRGA